MDAVGNELQPARWMARTGAGGRTRTGTGLLPTDFKSVVCDIIYMIYQIILYFRAKMCRFMCKIFSVLSNEHPQNGRLETPATPQFLIPCGLLVGSEILLFGAAFGRVSGNHG